ncbi:hypothetical protein Pyn_16346 [Prunus yedoensis var. nudiflora]|uniref:Uncharacterized protein n=1 Tax=Prunus yedoensis var. nudiflora TaxID=2094558 RepID=A0A314ZR17_PRUYE|nr:hypothetical protein Pyn_16346 [Prunus yedoensis var. nudiflora]
MGDAVQIGQGQRQFPIEFIGSQGQVGEIKVLKLPELAYREWNFPFKVIGSQDQVGEVGTKTKLKRD